MKSFVAYADCCHFQCGHLYLVKILINRGANLLAVNVDGNMPVSLYHLHCICFFDK